jgi:hypothetical protein
LDYLPASWNYLNTIELVDNQLELVDNQLELVDNQLKLVDSQLKLVDDQLKLVDSQQPPHAFVDYVDGAERPAYKLAKLDRVQGTALFQATVPLNGNGGLVIDKQYSLEHDAVRVDYTCANTGGAARDISFSVVLNLSFPGEGEAELRILTPDGAIEFQDLHNETKLVMESSAPFTLRLDHQHDGGGSYQFTRLVMSHTLALAPAEACPLKLKLGIFGNL